MTRTHPRPRRYIQPERVWLLKLLGFHYAHWRGDYILRVVGKRFGPVYRVTPPKLLTRADTTPPKLLTRADTTHPKLLTRADTTHPKLLARADTAAPKFVTRPDTTA